LKSNTDDLGESVSELNVALRSPARL